MLWKIKKRRGAFRTFSELLEQVGTFQNLLGHSGILSKFDHPTNVDKDTSKRTKRGIIISAICFKNRYSIRPFYSEFSLLFEFLKIFQNAKKFQTILFNFN
jgi:hypothetical protein